MPEKKHGIWISDEDSKYYKSVGERVFTYFRLISSKLEPEGTRGNDEDAGIIISDTAGWLDDPISGWWES